MGRVYLAFDERLDRHVAIKHVHTGGDATERTRFRREARSVARLSHPHIVQIFDVLETEDADWIVMELIDGPTVAQKLADGDLDLAASVTLARQVAEGLAEAHDKGVLHRDLKPENVLVDAGGRAKILDFGLAKPLWEGDTEGSLTVEGRVFGTCRSMSPEQARGLELDARSDLFSLGTLLYEMVTGESPFQGPTAMDTLTRVCVHVQRPARSVEPRVPEALSRLIDRLLIKDRDGRPSSAREVALQLAELAAEMGYASGPTSAAAAFPRSRSSSAETVLEIPVGMRGSAAATQPTAPWRSRVSGAAVGSWSGWLLPGVVLLAILAAAGGTAWWWNARTERATVTSLPPATTSAAIPAATPVRRAVAVLGFRNLSGEADAAWLATGLTEMLGAELAAGQRLRTVAGETVARATRELALVAGDTLAPDTLIRVRRILGADLVVQGSYLVAPGSERRLRVVLHVQDTAAGDTVLSLSETGSQEGLLDLISRVGTRLRRELGVGELSAAETGQVRASLPANPEALRLYSEGLERLRAYDYITARDLLTRAIEADPGHPLAHAALAEAWSALGDDETARREAHRAVEEAGNLSREDRLFVEGRDHEMSRRWEDAIRTYQALWEFFPDNVEYGLRLAAALTSAGRGRKALDQLDALRRAGGLTSEDVRIDLAVAATAASLGDYRRVLEVAAGAASRAAAQGARLLQARALLLEAAARQRLGEPQQASQAASSALGLYTDAGDRSGEAAALNLLGGVASETGDFVIARRSREEVIAIQRQVGNRKELAKALNNLGDTQMILGRSEVARPLIEEALAAARDVRDPRLESAIRLNLASLDLLAGDLAGARETAEKTLSSAREYEFAYAIQAAMLVLGQVDLAAGDLAAARGRFEAGLASTREGGDPHFSARFLAGLGQLELQAGNFAAARELHERALASRRLTRDQWLEAESRLDLALVAMEAGEAAAAAAELERVAADFHAREVVISEARANAALAVVRFETGNRDGARESVRRTTALLERCEDRQAWLWASILVARCRAGLGEGDSVKELEKVRREAARRGLVPLELEARLALVRLSEPASDGWAEEVADVQKAAAARGLGRLASQAAALAPRER